jgi:hypothetical protein
MLVRIGNINIATQLKNRMVKTKGRIIVMAKNGGDKIKRRRSDGRAIGEWGWRHGKKAFLFGGILLSVVSII